MQIRMAAIWSRCRELASNCMALDIPIRISCWLKGNRRVLERVLLRQLADAIQRIILYSRPAPGFLRQIRFTLFLHPHPSNGLRYVLVRGIDLYKRAPGLTPHFVHWFQEIGSQKKLNNNFIIIFSAWFGFCPAKLITLVTFGTWWGGSCDDSCQTAAATVSIQTKTLRRVHLVSPTTWMVRVCRHSQQILA